MTDYKAVAASLRACTDPQKHYAADVIDELVQLAGAWRDQHARELSQERAENAALREDARELAAALNSVLQGDRKSVV